MLRLARLARLVVGNRGVRQLFSRLGSVAVVAFSVMVGGAVVAYYAEHPINPEFATFGDSLWWSVVTLTTVGYGDIVPETLSGRMAAVMIMFTGVAVLGLLAGSLASFFRLQPAGSDTDQEPSEPSEPSEPAAPSTSTQPGPSTDPITRPGSAEWSTDRLTANAHGSARCPTRPWGSLGARSADSAAIWAFNSVSSPTWVRRWASSLKTCSRPP